jgi:hypothetical protein
VAAARIMAREASKPEGCYSRFETAFVLVCKWTPRGRRVDSSKQAI